ncbi:hypothetical protein ACQP2P_21295 [Dactylosporangium sp. CA-139114]
MTPAGTGVMNALVPAGRHAARARGGSVVTIAAGAVVRAPHLR